MKKHKNLCTFDDFPIPKMKKITKKYPKARLESCSGGKIEGSKYSHKNGCFLRLSDDKYVHSTDDVGMIVLDFNRKDEIIGIEFVDGIPYKPKKQRKKNESQT
jgi:hypothetical protein